MTVLITGARGMLGSALVKELLGRGHIVIGVGRSGDETQSTSYRFYRMDLSDKRMLQEIVNTNHVDRIIHLAALAHQEGQKDLSWECYRRQNVENTRNVCSCAEDRPLLFISTIDVYGFFDGKQAVTATTPIAPVSNYGKSKALAERECKHLPHYTIFRFCPVYSPENKRDIQKRYYLKYPTVAYYVGKGTKFEVLNINQAVKAMTDWCGEDVKNDIRIIKDDELLWTPDYIRAERADGRAGIVLHFPAWCINTGYAILKAVLGENEKTYLLNKLVHPLRTQ